jgi:hypothetical protein
MLVGKNQLVFAYFCVDFVPHLYESGHLEQKNNPVLLSRNPVQLMIIVNQVLTLSTELS